MYPHEYPHRILLSITGMNPQVVTETLYALSQTTPAFVPTEIHVITTAEGAREARLTLFGNGTNWFDRLCKEYALPPIIFSEDHIHIVRRADGTMLQDIRSEADNEASANFITEMIRSLTANDQAALHVSIAGGRKTMGFFAGYALSLFGRGQDRLSHVLVSEPFESNRQFFFPAQRSLPIPLNNGKHADASEAVVTLADIPFVPLRHGHSPEFLAGRRSYLEAVTSARSTFGPARLCINVADRIIVADGKRIKLSQWGISLLAVFSLRAHQYREAYQAPIRDQHDEAWLHEFSKDLQKCFGEWGIPPQVESSLLECCSGQKISENVSRLRKKLRQELGARATCYLSDTEYRITTEPDEISFVR